jgi:hypothetical protein
MGNDGADHPTQTDRRVLEFVADRLVEVYGENPDTDYIQATRRIAKEMDGQDLLTAFLADLSKTQHDILEAVTKVHVLVMIDTAIANGIEIPEEQMEKLRTMVEAF